MIDIVELNPIIIPPGLGIARDALHPEGFSNERYRERYDTDTLAYDRFIVDETLYLFCPKLLNFKALLLDAKVNGSPIRASNIQSFVRHDVVEYPLAGRSDAVRLEIPGIGFSGPCLPADDKRFDKRNVLVTVQKDNRLKWIEDWARSHVEHHGADAVLIFDNGSTAYPLEAMADTLSRIDGLKQGLIVATPFKYGPHDLPFRGLAKARFLKTAIPNLAKVKYLGGCNGALVIDIDEIVISRGGRSVFEATANSFWGYTSFNGEWWTSDADYATITHADHHKEVADKMGCPPKFCIAPHSPFWRFSLSVHKIESDWFKLWPASSDFYHAHHRKVTTNWKGRVKV